MDSNQSDLGLTRFDGKKTINVNFNLDRKNDWGHFKVGVAHEGSHAGQRNFAMTTANVRRAEKGAYLAGGYMSERYGRLDQYDVGSTPPVMKLAVVWNPSWPKRMQTLSVNPEPLAWQTTAPSSVLLQRNARDD